MARLRAKISVSWVPPAFVGLFLTPSSLFLSRALPERILEKCLHPTNKHNLRLDAFDLLLYYLSLKPANLEPLIRLYAQSVLLHPFRASNSWQGQLEARGESAITLSKLPTQQNTILMMEVSALSCLFSSRSNHGVL
jgi:hypothetical protein